MLLLVFINNCLGVSERERKRERMRESEQCKCRELFDKLALQINASAMISNWMFFVSFLVVFYFIIFNFFREGGRHNSSSYDLLHQTAFKALGYHGFQNSVVVRLQEFFLKNYTIFMNFLHRVKAFWRWPLRFYRFYGSAAVCICISMEFYFAIDCALVVCQWRA